MTEFFQTPPQLTHPYRSDRILRSYLQRQLPAELFAEIDPELMRFGSRVVDEIDALGQAAEAQPPQHISYDAWGQRTDHIEVAAAWKSLDRIAAEEKLVALAYERKYGAYSRLYQFAKMYLFHPSSAIYSCPLAMTDGAARALELYGDTDLKRKALGHLLSDQPEHFWTSGQWMTERSGGSDVSQTATVARSEDGGYRLYGSKWFTSATTSQMAMTLARLEGAPAGSRGLSLFYVELRDENGRLRQITVNRLKDKLGTRALPTAELTLEGVPAILVGGEGDGVKKIASLFNITRIYNACCAVGYMRRGLALALDYATKRQVFGKLLSQHSLHLETLAHLQTEFEAGFYFVFRAIELLGKEETGQASPAESAILRLVTPLVKLITAKQAVACSSEILESFGGAGYVEDTGLPRLLRDSQVLAIWEGTTNVLSLDALRALAKENAGAPFLAEVRQRLQQLQHPDLKEWAGRVASATSQLTVYLQGLPGLAPEEQAAGARQLALSLAQTYMGALLLSHADELLNVHNDRRCLVSVMRWCRRPLVDLLQAQGDRQSELSHFLFSE